MSSNEKSYPAMLDLSEGTFQNVIPMDQSLRDTSLKTSFNIVLPGQPVSTVEVSHIAPPKNPSHAYEFRVTTPEFEALPGVPNKTYDLFVNPETSEAVLFVVQGIIAEGISADMSWFYDEAHNMGMNLPNQADFEEFGHVFGGFCAFLARRRIYKAIGTHAL